MNIKHDVEEITPDDLSDFINKFKSTNGIGFCVTAPNKIEIIEYIDELSPEAQKISAVNVVKKDKNRLIGYNTDCIGFTKQLEHDGISIKNATIKLLGAGGAARSVLYALIRGGAQKITVYNRNINNAANLCKGFDNIADHAPLPTFTAANCDIIINTTSVGLNTDATPVANFNGIAPNTAVIDIIYNPRETTFMRLAKSHGAKTYNGLKMLIFQALAAHDIWLNNTSCSNNKLVDIITEVLNA